MRWSANWNKEFLFVFKQLEGINVRVNFLNTLSIQIINLSTIKIWQFDFGADNDYANRLRPFFNNLQGITVIGKLQYITHKNNYLFDCLTFQAFRFEFWRK